MTLFETIKDQDKKLGEILLEKKIIDEEQIQHVIVKSKESKTRFGETAVHLGIIDEIEFDVEIPRSRFSKALLRK